MPFHQIDAQTALAFTHHRALADRPTFLFVNSSGSNGAAWESGMVPALTATGCGTLTVDLRGQADSRFAPDSAFDTEEIVGDLAALAAAEIDGPIVPVGLSVGGLRAAHLTRRLPDVPALVLINCLRRKGPLTDWLGELETRLMAIGGTQLVHDCFRPVTVGTVELGRIRPRHLLAGPYQPMDEDHPRRRLAEAARRADWDFPWAELAMPVLVLTGMRDRLFRVEDEVAEILASMPNAREARFADEGHALHTEAPDRAAAAILAFTDDLQGAASGLKLPA